MVISVKFDSVMVDLVMVIDYGLYRVIPGSVRGIPCQRDEKSCENIHFATFHRFYRGHPFLVLTVVNGYEREENILRLAVEAMQTKVLHLVKDMAACWEKEEWSDEFRSEVVENFFGPSFADKVNCYIKKRLSPNSPDRVKLSLTVLLFFRDWLFMGSMGSDKVYVISEGKSNDNVVERLIPEQAVSLPLLPGSGKTLAVLITSEFPAPVKREELEKRLKSIQEQDLEILDTTKSDDQSTNDPLGFTFKELQEQFKKMLFKLLGKNSIHLRNCMFLILISSDFEEHDKESCQNDRKELRVFKGLNTGKLYKLVEELSQEKCEYTTYEVKEKDTGKRFTLRWYHDKPVGDQENRIVHLIKNRSRLPTEISSRMGSITFGWPVETVGPKDARSGFGYVVSFPSSSSSVNMTEVIEGYHKQPNLKILSRISYLICRALEELHEAGYVYPGINLDSIRFDFRNCDLVIWDCNGVVPRGNKDDGFSEFAAPEVMLGDEVPNIQSDLYSVAVFFYYLWMWEHPLKGIVMREFEKWNIFNLRKYYKKLLDSDPEDSSVSSVLSISGGMFRNRWKKLCPERLKKLFRLAFDEGIRAPEKRPSLDEWKRVFLELEANAVKCSGCGVLNVSDMNSREWVCFNCDKRLSVNLLLECPLTGSGILVQSGTEIRGHHLGKTEMFEETIGQIEPHPKKIGAFILRNLTKFIWGYIVDNKNYTIEPGQARALVHGGVLTIGNVTLEVKKL